jgi:hypothetical protein
MALAFMGSLAAVFESKAQQANPPAIQSSVSLVLVDTLAEDKKTGTPLEGLQQSDFILKDNGKLIPISSFQRGKDQKLRPIQLWFVLMCNEEVHTQVAGRRRGSVETTGQWGVSFLAGKAVELRPALEHLNPDDSVGVAHWCEDGHSEIDVNPSHDFGPALEAMDNLGQQKAAIIDHDSGRDLREEVTMLINNMARTAFPPPFVSIIYVGGKQNGNGRKSGDAWNGFMEESATDFGTEDGSAAEGREYAVKGSTYVDRLALYLDSMHRRYEIGFAPGQRGKRVNHLSVSLTKEAKDRYPNAVLRYREVYSDPDGDADKTKFAMDWKKLDSKMRAAVASPSDLRDLKFNAQRMTGEPGGIEHILVRIAQADLTWAILPNGDRRCVVIAVVASYSGKNDPVGVMVKELEVVQDFAKLATLKDKPVMLSLRLTVPKNAARVRVLVRDVANGHIGTRDVQNLQEKDSNETKSSGK